MWIKEIKLENFRNYDKQIINLDKNINIFYGDNAQGKTNIIESIFLCSMGKSFRTNKDREMIKFGKENTIVEVEYEKKDRKGNIKLEISDKKYVFLNKIKLKKLSELLGNLNIVIFNPDDIDILKGGPQKRRKFINILISQLRPNYMHILNLYIKTLEQRNVFLRQIKNENKDDNLLDIWDEKLADYGFKLYEYREEFIKKIQEKIKKVHLEITENKENIEIEYISDCKSKENFLKILKERRKIDIIKGYTTKGIHRDDFNIYINDKNINMFGSQGQHRTAILSLKLSELKIIYEEIGEYPILLLDDFMSELDEKRRYQLLKNIDDIQVIITCTEKLELENLKTFSYNVINGTLLDKNN